MTRQAINVGFPAPNFVAETGTRQAILPGVFQAETITGAAAIVPLRHRCFIEEDEPENWTPRRHYAPPAFTAAAVQSERLSSRSWFWSSVGEPEDEPDWQPHRRSSLALPVTAMVGLPRYRAGSPFWAPVAEPEDEPDWLPRKFTSIATVTTPTAAGARHEGAIFWHALAAPEDEPDWLPRRRPSIAPAPTPAVSANAVRRAAWWWSAEEADDVWQPRRRFSPPHIIGGAAFAHPHFVEDASGEDWLPFTRRRFHQPPRPATSKVRRPSFENINDIPEDIEPWYPIRRILSMGQNVHVSAHIAAASTASAGPSVAVGRVLGDADPLWVAVEIDLWDSVQPENADGTTTLCLSNRGPLTRTISGVLRQYEPRLRVPILLGSTLTIFSGGGGGTSNTAYSMFQQPLRGQPNGGTISWSLDPNFGPFDDLLFAGRGSTGWLDTGRFRWLGRAFRVYEGLTATDVGVDVDGSGLALVYTGRIAGVTYDLAGSGGPAATVQTTDVGSDLDKPLVPDTYPLNFPITDLRGKTLAELRGRALSIDPVLEDQATLIYRVTRIEPGVIELDDVTELRVGGVPWDRVASNPAQGQWAADLAGGTIQLGAVTDGAEVRVDAQTVGFSTLDTAQIFTDICTEKGVLVDPAYMAQLRLDWPGLTSFFTPTGEAKNTLDALDEITLANLCWWNWGTDGAAIAGFVAQPDPLLSDFVLFGSNPQIPLDLSLFPPTANTVDPIPKELASNSLTQLLPPAWRARIGFARRWSPGSSFLGGITDQEAAFWRAPELVEDWSGAAAQAGWSLSPSDGDAIKLADPRAQDLYISSLAWRENEAFTLRLHLVQDITNAGEREIIDVTAWMPSAQIKLFQTVSLCWVDDDDRTQATYLGTYRATSAIRSIGGGPQQLELWGNGRIGLTNRFSSFSIPAVAAPQTPTGISFSVFPVSSSILAGSVVAIVNILTSGGAPFSGALGFAAPFFNAAGLVAINFVGPGNINVVLARDATAADVGVQNVTISATQNLATVSHSFAFTVTPLPPGPSPGPAVLTLVVTPLAPVITSSTPLGTAVATLQGVWSDGSTFTGTYQFVAPNFNDGGVYDISGNHLIVSPTGPGVSGAGGTVEDVTLIAVQ